ncbi:MAG: ABC transporter substrate-binding protein [Bacillota bacterium]
MRQRRNRYSLMITLILTLVFAGCGQGAESPPPPDEEPAEEPAEEGPHYGGTMVIANYADITHLNHMFSTDTVSNLVNSIIHRSLVQYRGNNELFPMMAESWEIGEDGLSWTFHLRQGVTWHDGVEFTAEDVKWNFETIMDPATGSIRAGNFELVDRIEVLDSHTLRIITKEPYASLLDKVGTQRLIPKHVGEEGGLDDYNHNPIGTGPFKFVEWKPDEKIVLERFDDYWEGRPYLDRLEFVVIPEASVRMIALENEEIHYDPSAPPQEEIPRLLEDDRFQVLRSLATNFQFIALNCLNPLFEDYRARQAIAYAINKETIIDSFFSHTAVVGDGPFSEAYGYYYNADVLTRYRQDVDRARELLDELGWSPGEDGYLRNAQGEVFEFDTMVRQGSEDLRNVLVLVQQWLKDVGIKMNIQELEWTVILSKMTETRTDYDAVIVGFGATPDPDHHYIFHSEGGFWIANYSNERVDEVLERGRSVVEPAQRKVYYDEYLEITSREQAVVFLWHNVATQTLNSRFRGMKDEPAGTSEYIHAVWDTLAGQD